MPKAPWVVTPPEVTGLPDLPGRHIRMFDAPSEPGQVQGLVVAISSSPRGLHLDINAKALVRNELRALGDLGPDLRAEILGGLASWLENEAVGASVLAAARAAGLLHDAFVPDRPPHLRMMVASDGVVLLWDMTARRLGYLRKGGINHPPGATGTLLLAGGDSAHRRIARRGERKRLLAPLQGLAQIYYGDRAPRYRG